MRRAERRDAPHWRASAQEACFPAFGQAGAQVVLLKNLDQQKKLVNGSRGVVVGFSSSDAPSRRGVDVMQAPTATAELSPAQLAAGTPPPPPVHVYPRVRFFNCGEERLLVPEQWTIESGGRVVASRTQARRAAFVAAPPRFFCARPPHPSPLATRRCRSSWRGRCRYTSRRG